VSVICVCVRTKHRRCRSKDADAALKPKWRPTEVSVATFYLVKKCLLLDAFSGFYLMHKSCVCVVSHVDSYITFTSITYNL